MIRTQIQLSERQAERVRQLAAERGISMAELIRISVDQVLDSAPRPRSRHELRERARKLAGRFASGISDLAAGHDKHLSKVYGR